MERAAELSPDPADQARRLAAAASAAVPTGQADWVHDLATRALAITADPELRLTARHEAAWALAWSGRRTAALSALISVAEEAAPDLPAVAWDALSNAATVAYQSGKPASRQAVSRVLGLLESQRSPSAGHGPRAEAGSHRLWIRASTDPAGSRNQLIPHLRKIADSPLEEPSLWGAASAAWILDETDLAVRWLQDAMHRLRAPGVQGTSAGGLTVLGWAYIDTGRWDEALEVAAEAAGMAEANHMDIVAASADVITATVLALRADSAAARRHAARALASRRSGGMRADCRPGPAGPRRRRSRRRQLPPSVHPAPRAVQRRWHPPPQLRLLPRCGRSRRRRGPRRPADGRTHHHRARAQPSQRDSLSPARAAHRPGPRHPRRPGKDRSLVRQGALRPRRRPVAIRAGAASPRLRRMAAAPPPDQRRQARTDAGPGNLPAPKARYVG